MKLNNILGMLIIGALALGSCSTSKLASNQYKKDDDVYYSNAKAGDAPVYVANDQYNNNVPLQSRYNNYNDDDYYYYDSYASRINRFGYYSPFSFYDDIYSPYYSPYYGYSPYAFGYSPYYYGGLGLGLGFGSYFGYSPYYGYSPYGYAYNYLGTGYGYGGGGFWGIYSASSSTPRPYRGSGAPTNAMVNRTTRAIGYNGNYPVNSQYPGRPSAVISGGRQAVNSTGYNPNNNNNGRPTRDYAPQVYTPQPQVQSVSSSGSSGVSSGGSVSSGGGSRPVRP